MKRVLAGLGLALVGILGSACGDSGGRGDGGRAPTATGNAAAADGPTGDLGGAGDDRSKRCSLRCPIGCSRRRRRTRPSSCRARIRRLRVGTEDKTYSCKRTRHDIIANHEEVLNFSIGAEYVLPGLLLQGKPFQLGWLYPIPLWPRASARPSISRSVWRAPRTRPRPSPIPRAPLPPAP